MESDLFRSGFRSARNEWTDLPHSVFPLPLGREQESYVETNEAIGEELKSLPRTRLGASPAGVSKHGLDFPDLLLEAVRPNRGDVLTKRQEQLGTGLLPQR